MANPLEKVGGKVKQAAGKAIGSAPLKREGREQTKAAKADEKADKARQSARTHRSKAKNA